ncbi:MAG: hypothetical protein ACOCNC_05845 [Acetivibrio ethanolgignens]
MSKQRKRIFWIAVVVFFVLLGAVIYTDTVSGRDKMPGGVFVCL